MHQTVFTGAATAIITPMKNGTVDFDKFAEVLEFQIASGIDAVVVCGTTGESSTLTDEEHRALIEFCVKKANHRIPIIAGTGSNDTAYAVDLSKFACDVGADALLQVTPYYNKTTQKGLIKHFFAVADAVDKPIILYNVPSRTGININPETYAELCKHERIVAAKEAGGNLSAVAQTRALCGDNLDLYSGNDDQIIPIMSLGGKGVISVLSNLLPKETHDICADYLAGNVKKASDAQIKYIPLINALFSEVNPIPVKAAMNILGFCGEEIRLPLCEISDANKAKLIAEMKNAGLNF
ncbi:MAG: 4-hydroxy-tetrahydrodipicolinate synthase [Clostridia bacterium]|nr:4-hydroxy-tetrahydrodipicolinate synthase [Clostridia bacterium]